MLTLLAGCGSAGCTGAVMRAHGFTADQLAELVRIGFVTKATKPAVGGQGPFDIARFKITEAGQQALGW